MLVSHMRIVVFDLTIPPNFGVLPENRVIGFDDSIEVFLGSFAERGLLTVDAIALGIWID